MVGIMFMVKAQQLNQAVTFGEQIKESWDWKNGFIEEMMSGQKWSRPLFTKKKSMADFD